MGMTRLQSSKKIPPKITAPAWQNEAMGSEQPPGLFQQNQA